MSTKYFFLAAVASVMLAGCSSDDSNSQNYYDGKIRLSATNDMQVSTRTTDQTIQSTAFLTGEKIDIFMTDNDGVAPDLSTYTQPLVCTTTTASGTTSLSFDAGAQYWPINEHALNIWGVYPAGAAGTDVTAAGVPFIVKADQSAVDNYKASDLMTGLPDLTNAVAAAHAYDASVAMTFKHRLTKININLSKTAATTEITNDQLKAAKVSLINTHRKTTFVVKGENETLGAAADDATDAGTTVILYDGSTTANDALTYSCIIPPQTFAANTSFIKIELGNGDVFVYSIPAAGLTLDPQHVYTFDIQIHKASILLTATITDWNADHDGDDVDDDPEEGTAILQ